MKFSNKQTKQELTEEELAADSIELHRRSRDDDVDDKLRNKHHKTDNDDDDDRNRNSSLDHLHSAPCMRFLVFLFRFVVTKKNVYFHVHTLADKTGRNAPTSSDQLGLFCFSFILYRCFYRCFSLERRATVPGFYSFSS